MCVLKFIYGLRKLGFEKETACILPKRSTGGKMSKRYFFFFLTAAAAWAAWVLARRCWNLSTRPAVSTNFCWPVKKGWHALQIPTIMTGLVERVLTTLPQAQRISASTYFGCILSLIKGRIPYHHV